MSGFKRLAVGILTTHDDHRITDCCLKIRGLAIRFVSHDGTSSDDGLLDIMGEDY